VPFDRLPHNEDMSFKSEGVDDFKRDPEREARKSANDGLAQVEVEIRRKIDAVFRQREGKSAGQVTEELRSRLRAIQVDLSAEQQRPMSMQSQRIIG
jgi:hypothetical protein